MINPKPCKCNPKNNWQMRRVDLRSEKLEGDLGDEGLELWNNLGVFVLHWSFGLFGTEHVVWHRRLGVDEGWDSHRGLDGLEKNPNLELWLLLLLLVVVVVFSQCCCCGCCCCFSVNTLGSLSLGMDVQNALLHPVTFSHSSGYHFRSLVDGMWVLEDKRNASEHESRLQRGKEKKK